MRVLRYTTHPNASGQVPDYAALESGVMRPLVNGEPYELPTEHKAAHTVAKALCKGDLAALDSDTAKEAARMFGAKPGCVHVIASKQAQKPSGKPASAEG